MLAVVAVIVSPALTGRDSFPVSTYPMYAFQRSRFDRFHVVLGETVPAGLRPISLRVVANTDDPLIAEALVAVAIRSGTASRLCAETSQRVGPEVSRVLVVDEVHDVILYSMRKPSLQSRTVHAECVVER